MKSVELLISFFLLRQNLKPLIFLFYEHAKLGILFSSGLIESFIQLIFSKFFFDQYGY